MAYIQLEEPLQLIHKKFIALDQGEVLVVEPIVTKVLLKLVSYMEEEDTKIFRQLFNGLYLGGSFYHSLKIQNPDEFDIDFLLVLGKCKTCKITNCGCIKIKPNQEPGFLSFKIKETFCGTFYKKFCKNGFVQSNLVYNWTKSLLYKALHRYKCDKQNTSISKDAIFSNTEVYLYTECSPALKICIKYQSRLIYIDLAAAFKLDQIYWPSPNAGYKANSTKAKYFSIVPFSPKGLNNCWRPSFQEQEKEIIARKERLKPALRLLKMMKVNLNHKVSSYILKTLILEEADNYEWKCMSLAQTFMLLMQKYINCLRNGHVQYYWNAKVNLLENIKRTTLRNHCNEVNNSYLLIQREYVSRPSVIAEVILKSSFNYSEFCKHWSNVPKKKQIQVITWGRQNLQDIIDYLQL